MAAANMDGGGGLVLGLGNGGNHFFLELTFEKLLLLKCLNYCGLLCVM